MRRVVIAHNAKSESKLISDDEIPAVKVPGTGTLFRAWSADSAAVYPDAGQHPSVPALFPPVGGMRVTFCRYEPGQRVESSGAAGDGAAWEEDGMHKTDTTDVSVVLEGEIVLGIGNDTEVTLRKGDTTVMAGARHYWRNATDKQALLVFFMVGAHRRS